ncbi:DUF6286 domain-containing protein [Streptomyces sp. 549]|uniref:DUF6286 domain-containing protein n=1 Tax=Streptomyces sp. 549 TaxID=3049076 RepID=UPI0024C43774|nr:DUF6286 domain-containing protein [Streptomyces sp. 549]MDK1474255.1 DUF6286 domain-containing protein [Streptomyces sp. 549]
MSHDTGARAPTLDTPRPDGDSPAPTAPAARTGRFWSVRRIPATVVAALLAAATGLLLYDIVAVRTGRPAMAWRRSLAEELSVRRLDDPWVLAGAAVAVLLGVWLLTLALTPGLRRLLPMRGAPGTRAALDRVAAAQILRDRAMDVSGVQAAHVVVRRRRVRVDAVSHFRELDVVRGELRTVLDDAVGVLGLAAEPALTLRVRRPAKR